jgi:two-component sensor histidine kinase
MPKKRLAGTFTNDQPVNERLLNKIHYFFTRHKILMLLCGILVYAGIILIWGKKLAISGNYFVILPVLIASLGFGVPGGIIGGFLGLPTNLLMFYLIGHPQYSPADKVIAELAGISVGTAFGVLSNYFYQLNQEIHQRMGIEKDLRKTLNEKELLFQEMHHRVKNNLNIISSLVRLQSRRSDNEEFKNQGEELENRIFSIAFVHDQLYSQGIHESLDIGRYLSLLVKNILAGFANRKIHVVENIPETPIYFKSADLVSLSLLVNEIITNSMKYAVPDTENPEIKLDIKCSDDTCIISVSDNGPGFDLQKRENSGLGLKLIRTLSDQLKAKLEINTENRTDFQIHFPYKSAT